MNGTPLRYVLPTNGTPLRYVLPWFLFWRWVLPVLWALSPARPAWAAPPANPRRIPDGAYVQADGTRFVVAGKPFFFLGANFDPLHGESNRRRYREIIHTLAADGLSVGRVWVVGEGSEKPSPDSRKNDLFRAGPAGFIEEAYQQLDRVLAAARDEGVRLIVTLSNHWGDYGGVPMYLAWAGLPNDGMAFERFYEDEELRAYFRAGLDHLLSRRNTVTGTRYVDDPTIFAWELMNESQVLTARGIAARRRWIGEMARYIKARDGHHLVSAGLLGYAMRAERAEWIAVHQMKEIDYCDSHLYPQASGQVDSPRRLADFLDDRAQLARYVIGKPLIFGEFGFRTDGDLSWLGAPRAAWFGRFLDRILDNGGAGALAWIYEPFSGKPRDYGIYIDRPDTDDVRAAIRQRVGRFAAGPESKNPRLSAGRAEELLYEPLLTLSGTQETHHAWRRTPEGDAVLSIPPVAFARARFERAGVWTGGALEHAYGADSGSFRYRFAAPVSALGPARPARIDIQARLSSEWPGTSAPPEGGSLVKVRVDGALVGRVAAIPDDGIGRLERITIDDPALLVALRQGTHTLSFEVSYSPSDPEAHGLCIYGDATGKGPLPPGAYHPILIRYLPPAAEQRRLAEAPAP